MGKPRTNSGDINKRICKKCDKIKLRIHIGWFNDKDKKFADDTGKLWNGKTCPECHTNSSRSTMRTLREKADDSTGTEATTDK